MIRLILVVVSVLALGAGSASACSCLAPPPVQEAFDSSRNVFTGRVTEIVPMPAPDWVQRITFTVHAVWKGETPVTLVIETPFDGALCGFGFVLGEEYLVYTEPGTEIPWTHLCSRTTGMRWAGDDLAILGSPEVVGVDDSSFGTVKAFYED